MPEISWFPTKTPKRYDLLMESLELGGWSQYVRSPTRYKNILDLVFTNELSPCTVRTGKQFPGSDHNVVMCSFDLQTTLYKCPSTIPSRSFHKIDWKSFKTYFNYLDWNNYFTEDDADKLTCILYSNTYNVLDVVAPLGYTKPRIPKCMLIATTTRRSLRKHANKFYKLKDFSSLITMKEICIKARAKRIQMEVALEKQATAQNNSMGLLKTFRNKISSSKIKGGNLFICGNEVYDDPCRIADVFSEHFATSLTIENHTDGIEPTPPLSCEISDIAFTIENITKAITTLRHSYTLGPDCIPATVLKNGGTDFHLALLKLFAMSLSTACYPTLWKTTHVIPKFKSGPVGNIENYRPINLTSVASRVMEKIIKEELLQYLLKNELLFPSQHGFLKNRSCDTCLLDYLNDITTQRDKGLLVSSLFLDFSKAFDKVPHKRLLIKLKSYGVKDPLHSWFASFLKGRKQTVKFNNSLSSPKPITSGVIQGSVLGPLLFVIYINDINNVIKHGRPYLYADDLKIVYSFKPDSLEEGMTLIQKDLDNLTSWSQKWQLPLNYSKCGIMHIGNHNPQSTFYLNGSKVQILQSTSDLGIKYSGNLKSMEHTSSIISKTRRLTGFLLKNFHTTEAKLTLFKICVRPILEYCSFIFSSMNSIDRKRVESVQRCFTRRILATNGNMDYTTRCETLSLEPLCRRRLRHNLIFFYKVINEISFSAFSPMWNQMPRYELRNYEATLLINKYQTQHRGKFFIVFYSKLWNKLPQNIRTTKSILIFKRLISQYLKSKDLYQIFDDLPLNLESINNGLLGY
ncbi:hypothetical protein MN116_000587 [Schistosoma mekongi]|uniref:Reverse transcriptase domain-containing protein n=1 Tax=Schistosoma mekongi TaxID=38744 RepID=A0AAE2D4P0_SCHME|nr:hypothetical protein MN116_000587 [Schistosoma mekongi]